MKDKRLLITLLIVILLFIAYFLGSRYYKEVSDYKSSPKNNILIEDKINLEYVSIYLLNDGTSLIVPINKEAINKLDIGNNLKDRLVSLYNNATLENITSNEKEKIYKIKLSSGIKKLYKIEVDNNIYIVLLKEDNTIGLFDYDSYYNLMYTDVKDNYNNLTNVLKVEDNYLYYIDNTKVELKSII